MGQTESFMHQYLNFLTIYKHLEQNSSKLGALQNAMVTASVFTVQSLTTYLTCYNWLKHDMPCCNCLLLVMQENLNQVLLLLQ